MHWMLRVRAEEPCRDKTAKMIILLKGVPYDFSRAEGDVVVPCDILEGEYPEFLVPVFVALQLRGAELVEMGIDPGASRSGIVVLVGDEVVYKGVLPTSELLCSLERLSRYYRLRVYLGIGARSFSLEASRWGHRVEVVEVEERDLPVVEGVGHGKNHEVDALRILLKGKLIKMKERLENTLSRE